MTKAKISEIIEDIRTDIETLNSSADINELNRVSNRLAVNAKELKRRASRNDKNHQAWIKKLERYGF